MKERWVILGVVSFAVVALAVGIMGPMVIGTGERPTDLPWQIEPVEGGTIQVFGITLGQTPLREVELRFKEPAEISLFVTPEKRVVEAFFERMEIGGIGAKVVATLDLSGEELEQMYRSGARIATMGSGTRKVTLSGKGLELAYAAPVKGLTYLPKVNIEPKVISRRFGEPQQRIEEAESGSVHWLYPDKGLDLLYSKEKKEVLQYLPPRDFQRLVTAPLLQAEQKR